MNERYHVQDTVSATVEEYGNSIKITPLEVENLTSAIEGKTNIVGDFRFQRRDYHVVCQIIRNQHTSSNQEVKKKAEKFNWATSKGFWEGLGNTHLKDIKESIRFDLIFQHKATGNYGRATYALYAVSKKKDDWRLAYIGNPTTLINGHNSGPVILKEKPGFHENMKLHRIGFEFFFQCLGYKVSDDLKEALTQGLISLQNTQIAVYIPSLDKDLDLYLLKMIYVRWVGGKAINPAGAWTGEYLGLKPSASVEEDFTGVMLRGFSGKKNPKFTVNFCDKTKSNENKNKKGVSVELSKMLETSLRVDMTLHRRFIDLLASRTLTLVKKKLKEKVYRDGHPYHRFVKQMKEGATSTALVMCMIMHVLPKERNETFAKFLLREILCEECHLDKIVKVTNQRLKLDQQSVSEDQWTIFQKWKDSKTKNEWETNKQVLIQGVREKTFRAKLIHLESLLGVSLDVPYEFWINLAAFDGIYGLDVKDLEKIAHVNDLRTNDPEERLKAASDLFELMQKGRKQSLRERRESLTKTFLEPLGMAGDAK